MTRIDELVGETTEYDKKLEVEVKKPKSWCKSVSAFANTLGGRLYFGIADDGTISGLDHPEKDAEAISEIIKTRINPIPEFNLSFEKTDDGKVIIVLSVFKGEETPYYYSGDGVLEAYIRVGNESVKASPTDLKRLVLRGINSSYDSRITQYSSNDYSFSKLRERYKVWTGQSMPESALESWNLKTESGKLTMAGALLADESPIRYSRVFCTRWNGLTKSGGVVDALDHQEYSGSLISLLNNAENFIKLNSKTIWKKTEDSRLEFPDYVHRSYFEVLVNALVHRDYLDFGSEVHVDIFDDRLEIYSPGGMFDGSRIQDRNLRRVPSRRRNPILADVFNRLGYMERSGSGFSKILDGYEKAPNFNMRKEPEFYSENSMFLVTLPNLNYGSKTPSDLLESPSDPAESPSDHAKTPSDPAESPSDLAKTPSDPAETPSDLAKTPSDPVGNPSEFSDAALSLSEKGKEILQKMEIGREYSADEIADIIDLKGSRTRELLRELRRKDLIRSTGTARYTRYVKTGKKKISS